MERTLPLLVREISQNHPDVVAQFWKDSSGQFQETSYKEFYKEIINVAAGFRKLGVKRGDHVGLISENRKEWLLTDLGLHAIGAADVPRGNDSMASELSFILGFGDCGISIAENATQTRKILQSKNELKNLKTIILFDIPEDIELLRKNANPIKLLGFKEVLESGIEACKVPGTIKTIETEMDKGNTDDLATIIFTSGTTGEPKGVMLSHKNFLHQVKGVPKLLNLVPGDIWLCVLPVWHSFERIMQYVALGAATALAYSKPVGKIMMEDFATLRPTWMASVPRIWESVKAGIYRNVNAEGGIKKALFHFFVSVGGAHSFLGQMLKGELPRFKKRIRFLDAIISIIPWLFLWPLKALGNVLVFSKIKAKLGGRFVAGISGGGALPPDVDSFFAAAGILLLEGYGLTETAPVLGVREQDHPVPGTVGPIFPDTEIKIVTEDGEPVPPGTKGIVMARGDQVMLGYYKRQDLTDSILDKDGWLNTGDLGMLTWDNELKIMGRAKDTIVLRGGENIEPNPIEQKLKESPYVDQVVVIGQDQKFLCALIFPNKELIEQYARENTIPVEEYPQLVGLPEIRELINGEIAGLVNSKNGYKSFEHIYRFTLLADELTVGNELSGKQEIKRHVINEKYKKEIAQLFA